MNKGNEGRCYIRVEDNEVRDNLVTRTEPAIVCSVNAKFQYLDLAMGGKQASEIDESR
jgi:hypothetical protein